MDQASPKPSALSTNTLVTLLAIFLAFVTTDVLSTQWLLFHTPGGIVNELNPLGVLLYSSLGSAGMIFPRFGLFVLFAAMTIYFSRKFGEDTWFVRVAESLILVQIALSLVVSFNNFIAILAAFYVNGVWPLVYLPLPDAIIGIYFADLALGALFANGTMYMWGMTGRQSHLKVFVSLMVFITPVLLFSDGFRTNIWLFGLYVASASSAVGLFYYATERSRLGSISGIGAHK